MSVMGIDPSLTSTGYVALLDDGGMEAGTVVCGGTRGMERLEQISGLLMSIATQRHASLIAIEGYAFGAKGAAMFSLGELGGVIRHRLWKNGFSYIDVPPTMVKKFATGHGNSKKDEIMLAVYKRWDEEFRTSDEADAYVLARIALALTEGDDNLTEFQRDVIKALQSKQPVA